MRCVKCNELMQKSICPEHTEDLGGMVVKIFNAVQVFRCEKCSEEMTAIPDLQGLARAAAISRAMNPVRLAGPEVKFLRRVLDMKQTEFAEAMDLSPESVSRWENDARGVGGASEKLVRHNVCALIHKIDQGRTYDPAAIANLKFRSLTDGTSLPPIEMVRVRVQHDSPRTDSWGELAA